jgi:putative hydroxymethylpyrimidine transport system substrate-binding protein
METADAKFLSQTAENWQNNIDWMYEAGLIDKKVEVSDVMAEIEF